MNRIIKKLGMLSIAIMLIGSFTSVNAQNGQKSNNKGTCIENISGLTSAQIKSIQSLSTEHQKTMDAYRTEMRSTTDVALKASIRTEMDAQITAHRDKVKGLLTKTQKAEYDQWQSKSANQKSGKGNGKSSNQLKTGKGAGNCQNALVGAGNRNGCQGNRKGCKR